MTDQHKSAKSTAQRQADFRQRRLDEGLTEVRGLYANLKDHAGIKAFAKLLRKKKVSTVKSS